MTGDPIVEIREYKAMAKRCIEIREMQIAIADCPDLEPHERDAEVDRLEGRHAHYSQRMHQAYGALQNIEATFRPPGPRLVA